MKALYVFKMTLAWSLLLGSGLAQAVMINYVHNPVDREAPASEVFYHSYTGHRMGPGLSFSSIHGSGTGFSYSLVKQVPVTLDDSDYGFSNSSNSRAVVTERSLSGDAESLWLDKETYSEIPEPATIALLGAGLVVISMVLRRKRQ